MLWLHFNNNVLFLNTFWHVNLDNYLIECLWPFVFTCVTPIVSRYVKKTWINFRIFFLWDYLLFRFFNFGFWNRHFNYLLNFWILFRLFLEIFCFFDSFLSILLILFPFLNYIRIWWMLSLMDLLIFLKMLINHLFRNSRRKSHFPSRLHFIEKISSSLKEPKHCI